MRIACVQLAPELGEPSANIARADELLKHTQAGDIDYLILPELAFSGYNFPSLAAILPFLEPTAAGTSTEWARRTARRLSCVATVGYPEIAAPEPVLSGGNGVAGNREGVSELAGAGKRYNSTVTVGPTGEVLAHYRKSFLYYTDETWAAEGAGFYAGTLPLPPMRKCIDVSGVSMEVNSATSVSAHEHANGKADPSNAEARVKIAHGICMDINPYAFTAPWQAYEFALHCLTSSADLVVVSMAWLSHALGQTPESNEGALAAQPSLDTLGYWVERLRPLVEGDREVVVVCANRCGSEGDAFYAGTSTVMRLGRGRVGLWGILGRAEQGLLLVDTGEVPGMELVVEKKESVEGV